MLTHIHIKDFAIIDQVDLELGPGLTVLTGETGAGKSILVDALGLVLGDRADAQTVRDRQARAEITASFDVSGREALVDWLASRDMDAEGECLIRRSISAEGGSRAYVNGHPLTLQSLRQLGALLVDIHGQHEHQSLVRRSMQKQILDHHGKHEILLSQVAEHFRRWKALRDEYDGLRKSKDEREARLDLLRYQVSELEALSLGQDEFLELELEHKRLANSGELSRGTQQVLDLIYDGERGSAKQLLGQSLQQLNTLDKVDASLRETSQMLQDAEIQVNEAADNLRRYLNQLETDPARQEQVENRIADVQDLARKHRLKPEQLPAHLDELRGQLQALQNADVALEEMSARLEEDTAQYLTAAEALSDARRGAAQSLDRRITALMQELGMPGGKFEARTHREDAAAFAPDGLDSVEFLVSANPGQAPKPLAKVASGGELSRISLAIQVAAADSTHIPSIVFDEVDAGTGGRVAEIVGRRLRHLGESQQILCVTHLPQVASQSHAHIRVMKLSDGKTTRTKLTRLSKDEKVEEIARMLGGIEITARTREHAVEMLSGAGVD